MDEQMPTTEGRQSRQQNSVAKKRCYLPPMMITFGSMTTLTRGSGGDYDDECTSGKQPGDEDE